MSLLLFTDGSQIVWMTCQRWKKLAAEHAEYLPLELSKSWLDKTLSNLLKLQKWLCFQQGLGWNDFQKYLPTCIVPWFFASLYMWKSQDWKFNPVGPTGLLTKHHINIIIIFLKSLTSSGIWAHTVFRTFWNPSLRCFASVVS